MWTWNKFTFSLASFTFGPPQGQDTAEITKRRVCGALGSWSNTFPGKEIFGTGNVGHGLYLLSGIVPWYSFC